MVAAQAEIARWSEEHPDQTIKRWSCDAVKVPEGVTDWHQHIRSAPMPSVIKVNRAPVLTLWAAVVAERLGFRRDEALTLGRAVAGLNAYSKGVSVGLFQPSAKTVDEHRMKARPGETLSVKPSSNMRLGWSASVRGIERSKAGGKRKGGERIFFGRPAGPSQSIGQVHGTDCPRANSDPPRSLQAGPRLAHTSGDAEPCFCLADWHR
jgi:hypothetical protein